MNHEKVIAIGDIHFQAELLKITLNEIEPLLSENVKVIFMGDILGRSKNQFNVLETFSLLKQFKIGHNNTIFLLGNHEIDFLKCINENKKSSLLLEDEEFDATKENLEFLELFVPYYENNTHFFSHAGGIAKDGFINKNPFSISGFNALFENYEIPKIINSTKIIVRGHSIVKEAFIKQDKLISLDLGAFRSNKLASIIIPENKIIISQR